VQEDALVLLHVRTAESPKNTLIAFVDMDAVAELLVRTSALLLPPPPPQLTIATTARRVTKFSLFLNRDLQACIIFF
jgi:hypothetical protein